MLRWLKNVAISLRWKLHELSERKNRSVLGVYGQLEWLKIHDECVACGSKDALYAHFIVPFHLKPDGETDPNNLLTLCTGLLNCHFYIGHGGDWLSYNPSVVDDAYTIRRLRDSGHPECVVAYLQAVQEHRLYVPRELNRGCDDVTPPIGLPLD